MMDVQLLFGPMLIGVFFNMILYGILMAQMFTYYQSCKGDNVWIKFLVFYLFIAETINTGLAMATLYEPLVINFGTDEATTFFPLMLASEPIMIIAVSTPIQLFISWRIIKINKSVFIPIITAGLSIASCVGGIWTAVTLTLIRRFSRKPELRPPALLWLATAVAANAFIAFALIRNLYKRKRGNTKIETTFFHITSIILQSGSITTIAALADLIFFLVLPHTTLHFLWDFALTKLYSNLLMNILNARFTENTHSSGILGGSERSHYNSPIANTLALGRRGELYELEGRKSYSNFGGGTS